jgi:hypothetical protein
VEFDVLHSDNLHVPAVSMLTRARRNDVIWRDPDRVELHDFQETPAGKLSINNNAQACFPSLSHNFFVQTTAASESE